jgi:hypothetical protein
MRELDLYRKLKKLKAKNPAFLCYRLCKQRGFYGNFRRPGCNLFFKNNLSFQ